MIYSHPELKKITPFLESHQKITLVYQIFHK